MRTNQKLEFTSYYIYYIYILRCIFIHFPCFRLLITGLLQSFILKKNDCLYFKTNFCRISWRDSEIGRSDSSECDMGGHYLLVILVCLCVADEAVKNKRQVSKGKRQPANKKQQQNKRQKRQQPQQQLVEDMNVSEEVVMMMVMLTVMVTW